MAEDKFLGLRITPVTRRRLRVEHLLLGEQNSNFPRAVDDCRDRLSRLHESAHVTRTERPNDAPCVFRGDQQPCPIRLSLLLFDAKGIQAILLHLGVDGSQSDIRIPTDRRGFDP